MSKLYLIEGDQVYFGDYVESNNFITVYAGEESKVAQLNSMKPESLAYILLGHLIRDGHVRPEKTTTKKSIGKRKIIQITELINGQELNAFLVVVFGRVANVVDTLEEAESFFASLINELEFVGNTSP